MTLCFYVIYTVVVNYYGILNPYTPTCTFFGPISEALIFLQVATARNALYLAASCRCITHVKNHFMETAH